jgi:hypothetical protein
MPTPATNPDMDDSNRHDLSFGSLFQILIISTYTTKLLAFTNKPEARRTCHPAPWEK